MEDQPVEHETALTTYPERGVTVKHGLHELLQVRTIIRGVLIPDTKIGNYQRAWQLSG